MCPALAGGFLTTVLPGKSLTLYFVTLLSTLVSSSTFLVYLWDFLCRQSCSLPREAVVFFPFQYAGLLFVYIIALVRADILAFFFIYLFIYFWLCWVYVAVPGLSLVAVSGGYSSLRCAGFSLRWLLLLWSMGLRRVGFRSCGLRASVVVARRLQ